MNIPVANINIKNGFDANKVLANYEKQIEEISRKTTSGMTNQIINNGVLDGEIPLKDYSKLSNVMKGIDKYSVYVGIPALLAERSKQNKKNNAELLYIQSNGVTKKAARSEIEKYQREQNVKYSKAREMVWEMWEREHGSPAYRIPPRPVIEPALMNDQENISKMMIKAVSFYLSDDIDEFEKKLKKLGMHAARIVREWFDNPKNNWPPNAPSTKLAWAKKQKKTKTSKLNAEEIDKRPLVDTGELKKSITYVLDFPSKVDELKDKNDYQLNEKYKKIKNK